MEHIIQMKDVHRTYDLGKTKVHALKGITLSVEKSKFISLVGVSGCGKSTTFKQGSWINPPGYAAVLVALASSSFFPSIVMGIFSKVHEPSRCFSR